MALVGKSGCGRYFREREPGFTQHTLDALETPAQNVTVRRRSDRLVEGAREMMRGKPCHRSESLEAYFLVEMGFDVLADAFRRYRRQSATVSRGWFGCRQMAQRTDARAAVHKRFGPAARRARFAQRRRKQYGPPRSVSRAREPGGNIPITRLAEDRTVAMEDQR